jgi:hypothetical protein
MDSVLRPYNLGSTQWRVLHRLPVTSRPLKLGVTEAECCRLSNSPITGDKGSLRGRTADVCPFYPVEELLLIPPETKPASRPPAACDKQLIWVRPPSFPVQILILRTSPTFRVSYRGL